MSESSMMDRSKGIHPRLRAVVIDSNHDELVLVTKNLISTNSMEIVGETTSQSLAASLVERHKPDYIFISVDHDTGTIVDLIAKIRKSQNYVKIIAIGLEIDAQKILQCFRAGSDEFLQKPLKADELLSVFERLKTNTPLPTASEAKPQGIVMAVWGSRGGCGATTIACNLAHYLSQNQSTILIDLNFAQGDLSVYFDLRPAYSLMELSETEDRADETLIDSITIAHDSGLKLLLQPITGQPVNLTDEEVRRLLSILQNKYRFIILDIGHNEVTASRIVSFVTHFLLITNQNLPSIYLSNRKLRLLNTLGVMNDSISVVVNAYTKQEDVNLNRIAMALERSDLLCVRSDEVNVLSAMNQGIPLQMVSQRGNAFRDIVQLAENLRSQYVPESTVPVDGKAGFKMFKKGFFFQK